MVMSLLPQVVQVEVPNIVHVVVLLVYCVIATAWWYCVMAAACWYIAWWKQRACNSVMATA